MKDAAVLDPAGDIWLQREGAGTLTRDRFALLEQIAATGSITKAGEAVGISYRTAWLAVEQMNRVSDRPLVTREAGGKSGGGTRLTAHGEELLRMYRILQGEHARYLKTLRSGVGDFERFLRLTRKLSLKTSARNQLFGEVVRISKGELTATLRLRLHGAKKTKDVLESRITLEGLESLGLRLGDEAYALIKANWITVQTPSPRATTGAIAADPAEGRNRLPGEVVSWREAGDGAEAVIQLRGGNHLVASLNRASLRRSAAQTGATVQAVFSANDVILGVAQ